MQAPLSNALEELVHDLMPLSASACELCKQAPNLQISFQYPEKPPNPAQHFRSCFWPGSKLGSTVRQTYEVWILDPNSSRVCGFMIFFFALFLNVDSSIITVKFSPLPYFLVSFLIWFLLLLFSLNPILDMSISGKCWIKKCHCTTEINTNAWSVVIWVEM